MGEVVAGLRGGDTESGVSVGVTAVLKNGLLPGVPGIDAAGESWRSTSRGPPGVVGVRSSTIGCLAWPSEGKSGRSTGASLGVATSMLLASGCGPNQESDQVIRHVKSAVGRG